MAALLEKVTSISYKFKIQIVNLRTALDLAYKVHGKNPAAGSPPIVVMHGLLGSKKNWGSVSKRLSEDLDRSVVAVDARNHGESPHSDHHQYKDLASDLSRLISKLGVKQAVVIGHSMGGRTAMILALTEPNKVASLIVVDISPVSAAGLQTGFFPKLLDAMTSVDFTGANNVREAKTKAKEKLKDILHEGTMNFIIMNVGEKSSKEFGWICNVDALKNHFRDIAQFPTDMFGKQYNGPALFIGGDQSDYLPPDDLEGIRGLFPKANLKYVSGVGHNVHAEDAPAFIKIVTEYLKSE